MGRRSNSDLSNGRQKSTLMKEIVDTIKENRSKLGDLFEWGWLTGNLLDVDVIIEEVVHVPTFGMHAKTECYAIKYLIVSHSDSELECELSLLGMDYNWIVESEKTVTVEPRGFLQGSMEVKILNAFMRDSVGQLIIKEKNSDKRLHSRPFIVPVEKYQSVARVIQTNTVKTVDEPNNRYVFEIDYFVQSAYPMGDIEGTITIGGLKDGWTTDGDGPILLGKGDRVNRTFHIYRDFESASSPQYLTAQVFIRADLSYQSPGGQVEFQEISKGLLLRC